MIPFRLEITFPPVAYPIPFDWNHSNFFLKIHENKRFRRNQIKGAIDHISNLSFTLKSIEILIPIQLRNGMRKITLSRGT